MSRRTARAFSALTLVTAASVLTACGDDSAANPPGLADQKETSTSSAAGTGADVPKVSNPLDVTSLASDPCAALSSEQLAQFGLGEGETQANAGHAGKACRWKRTEESLDSVDFTVVAENTDGLASVYAAKDGSAYFEPTEVAGYPAVYTGLSDSRDSGTCDLWVGVSDQQVVYIMTNLVSAESAEASCGLAADVAEAAITTLGG
ncbi:DUF3558 domain-containing protein [Saccharomonospora xinjiangensis]|uniref:DUF3558 domain-containing protein n=1 Tax=Saccharomonospora xinjiangensis TaxID=75294 RepID=UPI00350FA3A7